MATISPPSPAPPARPGPGLEDPNDTRWRLVRATSEEGLWIAVRPMPRATTGPVALQKLRYGSTRTLVTFDADHLTPEFLSTFAARAHLTWHPHRIDDPQQLPPAWKPAIRALLHHPPLPVVAVPLS